MTAMPDRLTGNRRIPGPPCALGLLLDNVTEEDHATILEAIAMIEENRRTGSRQSNKPPHAPWLSDLLRDNLEVYVPVGTIQRHISGRCGCHHGTG